MDHTIDYVFFDLGDTLINVEAREWMPGAQNMLSTLRTAGKKIGVLSNTGTMNKSQLLALLPSTFSWDRFENELILLSGETGIEKPDPRAFELLIERARSEPADCLFCTENLHDTLVAQTVGLRVARISEEEVEQDFHLLTEWLTG